MLELTPEQQWEIAFQPVLVETCIMCGKRYIGGIDEHDRRIIMCQACRETVAEEMAELLDDMAATDVSDIDLLAAAAYFHAKFENIHPFADGNGRVGRTMMNYHLLLKDHPPITIHDEDRKSYYSALEAYHTGLDLEPLKRFLKEQTVKTWEKTLERQRPRKTKDLER